MKRTPPHFLLSLKQCFLIMTGLVSAGALYILSLYNYLLYHSFIELFSVIVAVSVFAIGWNTRHIVASNTLLLLAAAYGSVGALDLLHTLAYSGMGIFPGGGSNLATQLWIATRSVESLSLLAAALVVRKPQKLSTDFIFAAYAALTGALLLLIFPLGLFPTMYVEGTGLTTAKIAGEYIICGLLFLAIYAFWRQREHFNQNNLYFLIAALVATVASELSFTLYADVYGFFNFLGHLFKLVSFVLIYKALVSGLLRQPYQNLFHELAQSHDVLQEKERKLRIAEEELRAVFNNAPSGIILVDKQGTITFANQRMAEMLGCDLKELVGSAYLDHTYEQQLQEAEQKMFQLIRGEISSVNTERLYRRKNGTIFWGKLVGTKMNYPDGSFHGLAGIISNISEKKEAQQNLQAAYDKLDKLVELNSDGIMVIDLNGVILFSNPAAAHMFGRTQAELLGKQFGYPLTPGENTEIELISGNHKIKVTEMRTSKTEWDGKAAILASFRDITDRKEAEEELRCMGFRDSLTGLYNRNFFEEEMKRFSDGRQSPIGIIVCDIDGLKLINDTMGHQFGDEVVIDIANILKNNFRDSDIIARIGGDEFAILLPRVDQSITEKLLQRMRQGVEDHNKVKPSFPISLSMGYAVSTQQPADMQELFRKADDYMYRDKLQREKSSRSSIVQALTASMQARDFETEGHSERLKKLAASLGRAIDLSEESINDLILLARFHDLGKVGIPDRILFKPGPLTDQEMNEMQKHCEIGHRIAQSVPDLAPIAEWVFWHHERWDGQGYPQGLQGEEIPLPCRILAIVDAYDAMTSDRPYRKAMPVSEAIEELRRCTGTQFDPNLVEKFIMIVQEADSQ